jgi:hypothetical protein
MCIFVGLIYFVINAFLIYYGNELYKNYGKYDNEYYKKLSNIIHILSSINIIFVFVFEIILYNYYDFDFIFKKIPDNQNHKLKKL